MVFELEYPNSFILGAVNALFSGILIMHHAQFISFYVQCVKGDMCNFYFCIIVTLSNLAFVIRDGSLEGTMYMGLPMVSISR